MSLDGCCDDGTVLVVLMADEWTEKNVDYSDGEVAGLMALFMASGLQWKIERRLNCGLSCRMTNSMGQWIL